MTNAIATTYLFDSEKAGQLRRERELNERESQLNAYARRLRRQVRRLTKRHAAIPGEIAALRNRENTMRRLYDLSYVWYQTANRRRSLRANAADGRVFDTSELSEAIGYPASWMAAFDLLEFMIRVDMEKRIEATNLGLSPGRPRWDRFTALNYPGHHSITA